MAGLEKLLSLARAYEAERGPSLHGFLARMRDLETAGEVYGVPPSSEEEDAVTILTVHKAKGLEFPIVVLPHLDWVPPYDRLGRNVIIGEGWVGLRRMDFDAWARRDTSARWVLEEQQKSARRAEEARIFYVALTRARERLILVGSSRPEFDHDRDLPSAAVEEKLEKARSALDWLLALLPWERAQSVAGGESERNPERGNQPRSEKRDELISGPGVKPSARAWYFPEFPLCVRVHLREEITWPEEPPIAEGDREVRERIRQHLPLPLAPESAERAAQDLDRIIARAGLPDPFPPLARLGDLKGKYWVTEFKQPFDRTRVEDLAGEGAAVWNLAPAGAEEAALEGTRYHAALARLDLGKVTPAGLAAQMEAFAAAPWWGGAGRDPAIEEGLAACFRKVELSRLLACARDGGELHRESAFTLKWPVRELAAFRPELQGIFDADPRWRKGPWADTLADAFVLLQGRMDCLFRDESGWTVLDWKTDRVSAATVAARAAAYGPQMRLYAAAATRLWGAPVRALLAFVRAGMVVPVVEEAQATDGSRTS